MVTMIPFMSLKDIQMNSIQLHAAQQVHHEYLQEVKTDKGFMWKIGSQDSRSELQGHEDSSTLAFSFNGHARSVICEDFSPDGIYEKFTNAFSKAVQNLQVGNGLEEGVVLGPLINEASVEKIERLIKDATSKGATVVLGGKRHSLGMTFYEPTIISNVNNEILICREEIFGPVAPLLSFKTEEEAVHMANDTNAGLAAYIFTQSMPRSWRVSEELEFGLVGVNEGSIPTEVAPLGGFKQSGLGREGSKYGLEEFLEIKYVCFGNMEEF